MRASYKNAIQWIAENDDTEWLTESAYFHSHKWKDEEPILSVTAALVCDLFGKTSKQVCRDLRSYMVKQSY